MMCRDPNDDYLIEMAMLGEAAYLVSEDADLHEDADIVEALQQLGVEVMRVGVFARLLATM
jgi:predicted nucleic acid-binding protein